MRRATEIVLVTLAAVLAAAGAWQAQPASPPDGWRAFDGSWNASGLRQSVATELGHPAAILRLTGNVSLRTGALGRGFRGEAIGYDDGRAGGVGRAVWTDARGDRIFSELTGEPVKTGRRVTATITGGTGRYSGITGDYSFTWQYVVDAGGGEIQGHSTGLTGRYRLGGGAP
jgi:hypothetical protein